VRSRTTYPFLFLHKVFISVILLFPCPPPLFFINFTVTPETINSTYKLFILPFKILPHRGKGVFVHTLKEYGEIKVDHYPFLTSTLDGGERSVSGPGQHTPRARTRVKSNFFAVHAIKTCGEWRCSVTHF